MSKAIRGYMAETITAFQLDRSLFMIADATQDGTVKVVGKQMWFHCDNCKYHKIVASKQNGIISIAYCSCWSQTLKPSLLGVRTSWRAEWHSFFHSEKPSAAELAVTPFPSISSLLSLRREMKDFVRTRYPSRIAGQEDPKRRIGERSYGYHGPSCLSSFSPVVLLIRMLRRSHLEPRIKMPERGREIR